MFSIENYQALVGLGIPGPQITELAVHVNNAQQYVFDEMGPAYALSWFRNSLSAYLEPQEADVMQGIVNDNYQISKPVYTEAGYDSAQSHRALSKLASEAILLGGLAKEVHLLGLEPSVELVKEMCGSTFVLTIDQLGWLSHFTTKYGGNQDFLFPGVTPSSPDTPSLGDMAIKTLSGQPLTSVRTLTGVGGLRADADWNHVTDLVNFADLKVTEDKRYYPGLGIFYMVKNNELEDLPACQAIKKDKPELFELLKDFKAAIASTDPRDYEGVSVLCAALVPTWAEIKQFQAFTTNYDLNLESDFHSPSYEFMILRSIFEKGLNAHEAGRGLMALKFALKKSWSFNSTIHLPWTSQLAPLSNALAGKITNQVGDNANRYGVGHNGKSLEVVKYTYGAERTVPYGIAGLTAFALKTYYESDVFEGPHSTVPLQPNHPLWQKVGKVGFLNAALEYIA
jgi:hypothetical protein